jgi:hypothetical protein
MSKPRITAMADPPVEDQQSAIIVAVHTAREYLSLAERAIDSGSLYIPEALGKVRAAQNLLETAATLCAEADGHATEKARELLLCAVAASKAAYHQGMVTASYASRTNPTDFEQKQASKTRSIMRHRGRSSGSSPRTCRAG